MSYMKVLFEDIEILIQSGMKDEDIVERLCLMLNLDNKDWLLKQVKAVRKQINALEMED